MPKLLIDLNKLRHNAKKINEFLSERNISLIAVSKVMLGSPQIANLFTEAGIRFIGDSRIENIMRMKKNAIKTKFVLIRVPSIDEIPYVVKYADYSVNSELITIKLLSKEAIKQNINHNIILMIDLGDLREGVDINSVDFYVSEILKRENINLSGIGTNLKCFGGAVPSKENMNEFSTIAKKIQSKYGIKLEFVSGGNSANFQWLFSEHEYGLINNLRIGESLYFGTETIDFRPILDLNTDAIKLEAEIVEIKQRKTIPRGKIVSNAFGERIKQNEKLGNNQKNKKSKRNQALLNIGRQDVVINGLKPLEKIDILGASSDYIIIDIFGNNFRVGDKIHFTLNYEALLRAMTSPFIEKKYLK